MKYKHTVEKRNYMNVHKWLERFVKPQVCSVCNSVGKRIEWALKPGCLYQKDLNCFSPLCVPCHRAMDGNIDRASEAKFKKVEALKDGVKLQFDSIKHAVEKTKVLGTSISNNLKGRSKSAGGYTWQYIK